MANVSKIYLLISCADVNFRIASNKNILALNVTSRYGGHGMMATVVVENNWEIK